MKDGVITTNSVIGYKFDIIEINNKEYLYLRDNDIDYIATEYEEFEVEKPSSIVTPSSGIIIPDGIVTC